MKRSFPLISVLPFTLALATCGGAEPRPKPQPPCTCNCVYGNEWICNCTNCTPDQMLPLMSKPDAAVIVQPPDTCICACDNGFCKCACDGEPVGVIQEPPTVGPDAAMPPINAPDAVPTVTEDDAAPASADDAATKKDAGPDVAANKDVGAPSDLIVSKPDAAVINDAFDGRDSMPNKDADSAPDTAADMLAVADTPPEFAPDLKPDLGPDLPPPDLPWGPEAQPCTSTACLCPAGSVCQPTALLSLDHLTDYSKLGYSGYFNSQSGFGLYTQETATSAWNIPTVTITAETAPPWEVDITYVFTQVNLGTTKTDGTYNTPFYNWISAQCRMTNQANACGCSGISLEVKGDISKPRSEAGLRLSLDDIVCKDTAGNPLPAPDTKKDEIWWYNIAQADVTADWKEIRIPVGSFVFGNVRSNDRMLDLGCIQAFEINYQFNVALNCGSGCVYKDIMEGSGHFEVRNITTY